MLQEPKKCNEGVESFPNLEKVHSALGRCPGNLLGGAAMVANAIPGCHGCALELELVLLSGSCTGEWDDV